MRQGKGRHLARRACAADELLEHRSDAAFGFAAGLLAGFAERRHADDAVELTLDFRPRPVSASELEEWREYTEGIGLGEVGRSSDRTFGSTVVVIPDHDRADDDRLANLYARARLRLREARLEEDGSSLWFELHGPDGWVRVGRKVPMAIDAVGVEVS